MFLSIVRHFAYSGNETENELESVSLIVDEISDIQIKATQGANVSLAETNLATKSIHNQVNDSLFAGAQPLSTQEDHPTVLRTNTEIASSDSVSSFLATSLPH